MILTIRSIRVAVEAVVSALARTTRDARETTRDSEQQESRDGHG